MAAVTFNDVSKVYPDGTRAVSGMDLDSEDGEFIVLVGPSGCGKTTALRMVAGLEDITEGEIRIGERVVNHVPAARPRHRDGVPELCALSAPLGAAEHGIRAEAPQDRQAGGGPAGRERGPDPGPRPAAGQEAPRAVGRAAPARRDGTRDRARAAGLPDGRAAVQPRREAARAGARGDQRAAAQPGRDHRLRDARPGGGHDDGRSRCGDAQGRAPAGGRPGRALRAAQQRVRRPASSAAPR